MEESHTGSAKWFTYIVECSDGTLYTGITNNLPARINKHNSGKGAKYTRSRIPVVLVYHVESSSKSEAQKLECSIKKLSRKAKLNLIKGAVRE